MSKWVVDIHGDIEGDYEIIENYKEPKTGHWIEVKDDGGYKCSACECIVEDEKPVWKYCPNCGAKMSEMPTGSEGSDKE